ncbi:hypothetical protein FYK55_19255 [Roseiconus nitratireducens]|uniref:Secreted protein n=1 Tax=Roseiconus nitratireducens TaxID=2605748 RepID=A0A5M6D0M2_9BACT|nr:hypothetical protein [Roseiconus nitratireducens]KAA5541037.1 hypothetical protein FYK55_19255 [Roseiconus nitratireducens]
MSRLMMPLTVFGLLLGFAVSASAATTEGLEQGDPIGAFYVTKVAGAEDDGVEQGEQLCYRCKYGSRPMVMVFARDTGDNVQKLVKEIDSAVTANQEAELKGLLTLLGDDAAKLKESAAKVAKTSNAKNVPVVVAKDNVTGPASYKINEKAAVTVVVANDSQVVATHKFDTADSVDVAAIMGEVKKMLK